MSKFVSHQLPSKKPGLDVKEDQSASDKPRVMKVGAEAERTIVKPFEFGAISQTEERSYAAVKAKYGALAATDPERGQRAPKDSRFKLNPLLRDPLSVEQEERRVIEEKVRERVSAIADEAREKAGAKGYEEGLKKGYQEAFSRFQREGAERLESLSGMIAEFEGAKEQVFRANERFLLEMVYRISRMVLLREVTTDREYVLRLARELVERVGVRENIKVHIHQRDAESASMVKEGLEKALGNLQNLNVEVSDQVKLGGCVVETEWNAIDASIETQLESISAAMFAKPAADGGEGA